MPPKGNRAAAAPRRAPSPGKVLPFTPRPQTPDPDEPSVDVVVETTGPGLTITIDVTPRQPPPRRA